MIFHATVFRGEHEPIFYLQVYLSKTKDGSTLPADFLSNNSKPFQPLHQFVVRLLSVIIEITQKLIYSNIIFLIYHQNSLICKRFVSLKLHM